MCNRCNSKEETSLHTCPYKTEINNDYESVCVIVVPIVNTNVVWIFKNNIMKLELKHLSPYLPYKLNCLCGKKIEVIQGLRNETYLIDKGSNYSYGYIEDCKPILRPLSDLTKEIEVNGEKFVPEEYLNKNFKEHYLPEDWNAVLFIQSENILSVNYAVIQKLLEWHFDVFGLIEKGLAIDINTLNN